MKYIALGPPVATKPSGFTVGFCGARSPSCHVFHTPRQAMIKTYIILNYAYGTYRISGFLHCTLQWCHNEHDGVPNCQPHDCSLNRLFKAQIKENSELRVTGLCLGNSPVTGEFPKQRSTKVKNVSVWWHHVLLKTNTFHNTNIAFTGDSTGCHDNLWCQQWRQIWPNNKSQFWCLQNKTLVIAFLSLLNGCHSPEKVQIF